jgi:hypothetical protein
LNTFYNINSASIHVYGKEWTRRLRAEREFVRELAIMGIGVRALSPRWSDTGYCVVSDSWSNLSDRELGQARKAFGVHVMRLEVELFNSLMFGSHGNALLN